eukprot:TRINITY_DN3163_c0_g3_i1.p1 TRINITY_DN3163_c0_g3~~TRINITY_DN3163_c0_g3_i1.p1  ORF type:complete len:494 (+),score=81.27 TRINITY_DN3163_c0_g3_i1:63-1544(+)
MRAGCACLLWVSAFVMVEAGRGRGRGRGNHCGPRGRGCAGGHDESSSSTSSNSVQGRKTSTVEALDGGVTATNADPDDEPTFSCNLEERDKLWGRQQWHYCCRMRGVCPPRRYSKLRWRCMRLRDQIAAKERTRVVDKMCCRTLGVGCLSDRFSCFVNDDRASWSQERSEWCCTAKNVCAEEKEWDAVAWNKRIRAEEEEEEEPKDDAVVKKITMAFNGNEDELVGNPSHLLYQVRRAVLAAAPSASPSDLLVRRIGIVLPDSTIPSEELASSWAFDFTSAMNENVVLSGDAGTEGGGRRGVNVLQSSGMGVVAQEGRLFYIAELHGSTEASLEALYDDLIHVTPVEEMDERYIPMTEVRAAAIPPPEEAVVASFWRMALPALGGAVAMGLAVLLLSNLRQWRRSHFDAPGDADRELSASLVPFERESEGTGNESDLPLVQTKQALPASPFSSICISTHRPGSLHGGGLLSRPTLTDDQITKELLKRPAALGL